MGDHCQRICAWKDATAAFCVFAIFLASRAEDDPATVRALPHEAIAFGPAIEAEEWLFSEKRGALAWEDAPEVEVAVTPITILPSESSS